MDRFQLNRALKWLKKHHWIKTDDNPLDKDGCCLHIHIDVPSVQRKLQQPKGETKSPPGTGPDRQKANAPDVTPLRS